MGLFKKATRKKAKLRLSIDGPSGSGKTHSALLIAAGLAGDSNNIFLIDSENDSASMEADKPGIPGFQCVNIEAPYSPERYINLINAAVSEGAEVLIIDSLSHAWSGQGGILEMTDDLAANGNKWAAWRTTTPKHNALVSAILSAPCHVICTMRTKTSWEVVENDKGKKVPRKIGLKPEQREGMEYEFTVVVDMSIDHVATASKDRTSLFDGEAFVPSRATGEKLIQWLERGEDMRAISAGKLEELKSEVDQAKDEQSLVDWWKTNTGSINILDQDHKATLTDHCGARRRELKVVEPTHTADWYRAEVDKIETKEQGEVLLKDLAANPNIIGEDETELHAHISERMGML